MATAEDFERSLRETVRKLVGDDELYEVMRAAADANREAREQHDSHMLQIQDQINRRAAFFGEGIEQTMRMAQRLERP